MSIPYLTLPQSLKDHTAYFSIVRDASELLKTIPEYKKLKLSQALTQHMCSVVLNLYHGAEADRDEIVIKVLQLAFLLTDDEVALVKDQIKFIHSNKLAKKIKWWKRVRAFFFGSGAKK